MKSWRLVRATQSAAMSSRDVGREAGVLDVVGGRDQVLDLVVEERVVAHAVHVVAKRQHAVVGAEGAETRLPERLPAHLQQQPAQEEEQGVAPVGRVGPVPHRFHVEVRLEHAAHQLEDLVRHVRGARGEDDGGAERRGGRGGGVGQVAGQLDQIGQHPAARGGLDLLRLVAGVAAHVERLPRRARERRSGPPAPAGVAGHRARRDAGEPEERGREIGLAGDHETSIARAKPRLDARDGPVGQMPRVGHEQHAHGAEPLLGEIGLLHEIVLEVAAGEQHGGAGGGQVGVLALEPGAGTPPRVGEPVGLAPRHGQGRVGVAARPAPQHRDVVPPGTDHAGQSSGRTRALSSLVCVVPPAVYSRHDHHRRSLTRALEPALGR